MIRENFTFWREINKLSKLGKFGASQLQTDPPFQKKKRALYWAFYNYMD